MAANNTTPRVEGQDLFEDQFRARHTRSVRRASGLVLAADAGGTLDVIPNRWRRVAPMPAKLTAVESQAADEVDAYERLGDAMHGDGMLFVWEDAVEAAWAIVEPDPGEYERYIHTRPGRGDLTRQTAW